MKDTGATAFYVIHLLENTSSSFVENRTNLTEPMAEIFSSGANWDSVFFCSLQLKNKIKTDWCHIV